MSLQRQPIPNDIQRQVEGAFDRHRRGDIAFARRVYEEVLSKYPEDPRSLHYLGLAAQQTGNSAQAIQLLERSIDIDPADPRAYNHLGLIHVSLDDKRKAAECFERGLRVDPDHVELLNSLANVIRTRDLLRAIGLYRRAFTLSPKAAFIVYNLAQALDEDHAFDEAAKLYERAIELDPRHSKARHCLGILLEQRGQFDKAIEQYLTVQRLDPRHVSSLANILAIHDFLPDAAMVRKAEEILATATAQEEDRIKLHRGLGKHYEREQAYGAAFSHFKQAKLLFKQSRPAFDLKSAAKSMGRLKQVFGSDLFFEKTEARVTSSERPIFIVGLPRSGTTLTEQIIASHPRVFGAGELQNIPQLVKSLRPDYPECLKTMDSGVLQRLANGYLDTLEKLAGPSALRVTDKMPVNSLHLGLIAKLFPRARIVYCRRDPLDIAISCFVELFQLEHDYTTDFDDFGRYYLEHERLMAHWKAVLPVPIHELRYEELIASPEKTSRELIEYCGLDWHSSCLEFQKTKRTVQTPSRWQVRQPIYQTSVGRWRNYSSEMAALDRLLRESGAAYRRENTVKPDERPNAAGEVAYGKGQAWDTLPAVLANPLFIVAAPRSGSTLLFETLAKSDAICTVGGEAHWLVENIPELQPGMANVSSNRLTAEHVTERSRDFIISQIVEHLVDDTGTRIDAGGRRMFLEKTPKNALRIPFFDRIFPGARFVFLWRDPRQNISSIMEAWRSGRFITYKQLAGFAGPWSLLLPPGYQQLSDRSVEEIAAFQWESANRIILNDLEMLDPKRWMSIDYASFLADPEGAVMRILDFAMVSPDPALMEYLRAPLPRSRYTQTAPAAEKWRFNEAEVERVLPSVTECWQRLRNLA
jgi:Flp pilus assembly protein TadD